MTNEDNKHFDEFVIYLNKYEFYEAHESIEAVWFQKRFEDTYEVKLLKGFINAAVSFELMKKGKIEQSRQVWKTYLKYRQLIYKIDTPDINKYYQVSRNIDKMKLNF